MWAAWGGGGGGPGGEVQSSLCAQRIGADAGIQERAGVVGDAERGARGCPADPARIWLRRRHPSRWHCCRCRGAAQARSRPSSWSRTRCNLPLFRSRRQRREHRPRRRGSGWPWVTWSGEAWLCRPRCSCCRVWRTALLLCSSSVSCCRFPKFS